MNTPVVFNPFDAPIHRFVRVASTMDEARRVAAEGAPHGTVVTADAQDAGRGRVSGRVWTAESGQSLLCTVILRYRDISSMPSALPLRVGLAAAMAVEDMVSSLRGRVFVKWPNDVLVADPATLLSATKGSASNDPPRARKLCGILCESDGRTVYAGIGINVSQKAFPGGLSAKATSLEIASAPAPDRYELLGRLLDRLSRSVSADADSRWKAELEARLYRRGLPVSFMEGAADSGRIVEGVLSGIGEGGELLIRVEGEAESRAFAAGELLVYDAG